MKDLSNIKTQPNEPKRAGQRASWKRTFGDRSRYAVYAVHTRFDAVQWFVADAETPDTVTGCPSIVRQSETLASAIFGLEER